MIKIENTEVVGWEHAIRGMRNPKNSWDKSDSGSCLTWECSECGYYKHDPEFSCGDRDDYLIGPNDHKLMMSLAKGGPVHAKYRRMIVVYADITAPLYFWKEADTYRMGVEKNSCSTMHKIHAKEFTLDDFSHEHLIDSVPEEPIPHEEMPDGITIWSNDDTGHLSITCTKYFPENYSFEGRHYISEAATAYFSQKEVLDTFIIPALNANREAYLKTNDKRYWWQMIQLLPSSYNQKRTVLLNYESLANMYKSRKNHKLDEWHTLCAWIESLPYSEIITGEKEKENDNG